MKKSMLIGFDFDKIFIDTPPFIPNTLVDFLYKGGSYFKRGGKKSHLHYRYPGYFEQKIRVFSHTPIFRPPLRDNLATLEELCKRNDTKLYLISSRFSFLKARTEAFLKKSKLKSCFEGMYFNFDNEQPHLFKLKMIKKLKIDTYIDDDLDVALYLSEQIPKLKIYWVTDGRSKETKLPTNITAIKNLKELEKYL